LAIAVEPGIMSFINHGCRGTNNIGWRLIENEMTLDYGHIPKVVVQDSRLPVYHPRVSRHFPLSPNDVTTTLVDIAADSELLDNYLTYGGVASIDAWNAHLGSLKLVCSGGIGSITEYEAEAH
jgi:hypothetical protein